MQVIAPGRRGHQRSSPRHLDKRAAGPVPRQSSSKFVRVPSPNLASVDSVGVWDTSKLELGQ